MQLRRIVAIKLFIVKGSPVIGGVRLADEEISEEKADDPNDD